MTDPLSPPEDRPVPPQDWRDGHDYSPSGKHDPISCRLCLQAVPPPERREAPLACSVCREVYATTGQQTRSPWGIWGEGFRVCRRCREAGRDARLASSPAAHAERPAAGPIDTYTPLWWATLTDDERWTEYIKLRAAHAERPATRVTPEQWEHLHSLVDALGVPRTVDCSDGSEPAVLWLTARLRLAAEARAALSERAPEPPASWMTHHRSHGDVVGTERYYECKACGATLWRAPEPQK